jgi:hypothetical protein
MFHQPGTHAHALTNTGAKCYCYKNNTFQIIDRVVVSFSLSTKVHYSRRILTVTKYTTPYLQYKKTIKVLTCPHTMCTYFDLTGASTPFVRQHRLSQYLPEFDSDMISPNIAVFQELNVIMLPSSTRWPTMLRLWRSRQTPAQEIPYLGMLYRKVG